MNSSRLLPLSDNRKNFDGSFTFFKSHFFSKQVRMLNEGWDNVIFGNGFDNLPADEDLSLSIARGHTEVSLTSLTRAIHHAAHDGNTKGNSQILEAFSDIFCQRPDINLGTPTGRTGNNLEGLFTQAHEFQELRADLDLFNRRCGKRDPASVTPR